MKTSYLIGQFDLKKDVKLLNCCLLKTSEVMSIILKL